MPSPLSLVLHLLALSPLALGHSTRSRRPHKRNARCAARSASVSATAVSSATTAAAAATTSYGTTTDAVDLALSSGVGAGVSVGDEAWTSAWGAGASDDVVTYPQTTTWHVSSATSSVGASSVVVTSAVVSSAVASNAVASSAPASTTPASSITSIDAAATSPTSIAAAKTPSSTLSSISSSTSSSTSTSSSSSPSSSSSSSSSDKYVFAHFMVGIVSSYTQAAWEADMTLAASKGIDGFALNIGVDSYTSQQLSYAYAAAAAVGFKCFISFDFNWYTTSNTSGVIDMLSQFVTESAQFTVDGAAYVSTFIGDGFDWATVQAGVGTQLYVVPDWDASADYAADAALAGLFSWDAWPNSDNAPINASMTTANDETYIAALGGKPYMAPISPWFFTHFGADSYDKNWLFKSETLWKDRWDQILSMSADLQFVEIITWNDYGESSAIGPYDTPHTDDGSSAWAAGLDHTPMMDLMVPYIAAFKAGASEVTVTDDLLVYWHRPHLKTAECDSTDSAGVKPTGWDYVSDTVFVTTLTSSGGSFTATSGSNAAFSQTVAAGVQIFEVPMAAGTQTFSFTTAQGTASATSNITVSSGCWNGEYNFNFHAGEIALA
ncbi:hypothetical protein Q5752_004699 [Cryptotrichosporon argae]